MAQEPPALAYCPGCGKRLLAGDQVCPGCGRTLHQYPEMFPPVPQYSGYMVYAGFWKRVGADLIDSGILWITSWVVGYAMGYTLANLGYSLETLELVGNLIGLLMTWLYYAIMESSGYQGTPGKLALGIMVTDLNGQPISFWRATGRHFGKIISGLILSIGFLMAAWTDRKQTLHDIMAGCVVIER